MDKSDMGWIKPQSTPAWKTSFSHRPKNWRPIRFTGRFRKMNSVKELNQKLDAQLDYVAKASENYPSCVKQFHNYCQVTTMHGIRYVAEEKRHVSEKIFWSCWCVFGISAAIYMMSKIYTRWESSPVITSVSNTNFPVTNINFPAVTICTVNKAVNEKMIIQACNYNLTLSKMRSIISQLVDPEARNNDNIQIVNSSFRPKEAMKYLRLVAPKCEDYLLTCRWNSATAKCNNLFKLTLTDTGYCCTFNAIEARNKKSEGRNEAEVLEQEANYAFLQKAVWDYYDQNRDKNGYNSENMESNATTPDAFTCQRVFDDDLFPGICQYLKKCKDNPKVCKLSPPLPTTSPLGGMISDKYPLKALGAGRSRGLTLMLDTLRCDTVPTDSFKGLRVLVHDPEEFPAVGERGFIVGPGMETQVAVTATDTFSAEVLRAFTAERRGCYFSDEFPLKYYKEYSRSSCVLECENNFIFEKCNCVPYYAPGNYSEKSHGVCSVDKIQGCVRNAITNIAIFKPIKGKEKQEISCTEFCLPACNETFYNFVVTAATFPNQPEPNMTQMLREAIHDNRDYLNNITYVSASISVLRVFFRESSIMQYKRDELFTWEDFVSNLGGVMGLCLGFSLLSLVEIIYFFTMRFFVDWHRYKKAREAQDLLLINGFKY
ncbi:unnamed protein product [Allacma fusca]|uniref:Pickpocket protein 28 n=1 Tax=Allacma fusca TaxID=39272 RepID=A0A8J2LP17_9HEXA|nr:unnamed protein product [Allacma fusca]